MESRGLAWKRRRDTSPRHRREDQSLPKGRERYRTVMVGLLTKNFEMERR